VQKGNEQENALKNKKQNNRHGKTPGEQEETGKYRAGIAVDLENETGQKREHGKKEKT
jgi:hypothetical protein